MFSCCCQTTYETPVITHYNTVSAKRSAKPTLNGKHKTRTKAAPDCVFIVSPAVGVEREDYRRLVLCCHTGNLLRAALESRVTIKAHPKPVRVTSSPTLPYRPKSGGWVGLSALSIYATNCNFNTRDPTSTENQYRLSKRSPVLSRVRSSCLQAPQTEVHSTTTCRSKYQICVTTTTIPRWRSYVHVYIYSTRRAALPDMQGGRK